MHAILAMARHLTVAGEPFALHHFARSREYTAFHADQPENGGAPFQLVLARTGHTIEVDSGETALDALGTGIDADSSCEQGICGTCVTTVLGGAIDHRDQYLTDAERAAGDRMCLCGSRCRGARLVLDR